MHRRIYLITGHLLLAAILLAAPAVLRSSEVSGEPDTYGSPFQAGCYIAGPNDCRIHTDPFSIKTSGGKRLVSFTIQAIDEETALETTLYDFKTDINNPDRPKSSHFSPSLVAQDFAASCGKTYHLNLLGVTDSDASVITFGTTAAFTCPAQMP